VIVNATLDLGSNPNPSGTVVQAALTGGKTGYPLTYSTSTGQWSGTMPIAPGSGGNGIDLWVCSGTGNCTANKAVIVPHVQAAFASNQTLAQDVDALKIIDANTADTTYGTELNDYPMCSTCTATVNITADIAGSISDVSSQNAPLFPLNFGSTNTASQTGTVECPPGNNSASGLANTISTGCAGQFAINTSDPSCQNGWPGPGPSPGGANGSGPPADCVQTKNGLATGQVDTAIYNRFVNPTNGEKWYCQNNWSSFDPSKANDGLPSDDSRIINVIITPLGTFTGSGSSYYPIQDIATFYVMGWSANNGNNGDPCATDPPVPASSPNARFWGYFIHYTAPNAIVGTQSCSVSALGSCTLALTQ
jgi:hypothetical protein